MNPSEKSDLFDRIREELRSCGIDLEAMTGGELNASCMKVVCVPVGLGRSLEELGRGVRDRVVMVRVDEETSQALDDWVETGTVKSRSEAAALFIREGLKVRAGELDQLEEALKGVEEAKERLRQQAREVFGGEDVATGGESDDDETE